MYDFTIDYNSCTGCSLFMPIKDCRTKKNFSFFKITMQFSDKKIRSTETTIQDTFIYPEILFYISATSCYDVAMNQRYSSSGIYTIYIEGDKKFKEVYCDMSTNGGGWTVIQRRGDFGNSEDYFQRNWTEYRNGFGHPKKEVWFGLNDLYLLTKSTPVEV